MGLKLVWEVVFLDLGSEEYFITNSLELLVNGKENKPTPVFTVGLQFYADHHPILSLSHPASACPCTGTRPQSPAEYDPAPSTLADGHPISTSSQLRTSFLRLTVIEAFLTLELMGERNVTTGKHQGPSIQ